MNLADKDKLDQQFQAIRDEAAERRRAFREASGPKIHIGMATCGIASGALETRKAFEDVLAERDIQARIHAVGCIGHCYAEPVVVIEAPGFPPILYHQVTPGKARMLVKSFLEDGDPLFEHVLGATEENELIPSVMDFPRFNREERVVMEKCGRIDPEDILITLRKTDTPPSQRHCKEHLAKSLERLKTLVFGAGGALDSQRAKNGHWQGVPKERRRLSSATRTKGIRVHIWTA
jgi:(2Fe-2S) ferredoxin